MTSLIRKDTARHYRHIRKILNHGRSEPEPLPPTLLEDENTIYSASMLGMCLLLAGLMFIASCIHSTPAQAFTDEQYVNAIYHAEGIHAKYAYGIRSVHYNSLQEARKICLRTVKHCRERYREFGFKEYPQFIEFLQSVYCPTQARNLSQSEIRLNRYWIANVSYFLRKEVA